MKRYDVYGKELNDHDPDSEWFWIRKSDADALAAENARLREAMTKAADTLADAARTFSLFGKNVAASAMLIAEEHTRAALQPNATRSTNQPEPCAVPTIEPSNEGSGRTGLAAVNQKCPRCGFVTANVFDCPTCKDPMTPFGQRPEKPA